MRVTLICEHCGCPFEVTPYWAKQGRRFCSRACKDKAQDHSIARVCEYCGKDFKVPANTTQHERGKFCSRSCAAHARRPNVKVPTNCLCCGKSFDVFPSQLKMGWGKYCSKECQYKARRKRTMITCEGCGKEFETHQCVVAKNGRKYCSRKCSGIALSGQNHVYWRGGGKHYRGPNWTSQKRLAYERDGGKCQICHRKSKAGKRKNAVHHIKPFREFNGDYIAANDLSNLITLCHGCHNKVDHNLIPTPKHLL